MSSSPSNTGSGIAPPLAANPDTGGGNGNSAADQVGPMLGEVLGRTHAIRRRSWGASDTDISRTIADLVEAVEILADAVGREYGLDLTSCPRNDGTPGSDS